MDGSDITSSYSEGNTLHCIWSTAQVVLYRVRSAGTLGASRNLFQPSSLLPFRQEMTTESVKSICSYLSPFKRRQVIALEFCVLLQTTKKTSLCLQQQQINIHSFNLLAPEFYIYILAHSVGKMWIIRVLNKVALWNKWHFEEKNGECAACLKYSVLIVVEKNIYNATSGGLRYSRPIYRTRGS
jgi:hypothetical protein